MRPFASDALAVRFLLTGDDSIGSVAAWSSRFRPRSAGGSAHASDHYEETVYGIAGVWTMAVDGTPHTTSGRDRRSAFRAVLFTDSTANRQPGRDGALPMITPAAVGPTSIFAKRPR